MLVGGGTGCTRNVPGWAATIFASHPAASRYALIRPMRASNASSAAFAYGYSATRLPPWRRCQMRASSISGREPQSIAPAMAPMPL
jgi:hypothetical protein